MKVLGLDLGVSSIGWAIIELDDNNNSIEIIDMGSRIVNLTPDETKSFTQTKGETPNAKRTFMRTARKMSSRWKQRRKHLQNILYRLGMYDRNDTNAYAPLEIWEMRAKAAIPDEKIPLKQLGTVLLHLSSKRGYRHTRINSDNNSDETKYVAAINQNYKSLLASNMTLGQLMYQRLKESEIISSKGTHYVNYRIKEGDPSGSNLLPRKAHEDELMTILTNQQKFYPELLTDNMIAQIFKTIYYQRPLKSCKHLVSRDDIFSYNFTNSKGNIVSGNPHVAPRTSPIAQLTRIWETVNNIKLINRTNKVIQSENQQTDIKTFEYRKTREVFEPNLEEKIRIAEYLNTHDKLTQTELLKLLNLKRSDGFKLDTNIGKGIKGNSTYTTLWNILSKHPEYKECLDFNITMTERVDRKTGEICHVVSADIFDQPLYRLWHLIYSLDQTELSQALTVQFGINDSEVLSALCAIDFTSAGFSNKSAKFMRYILPYLMQGYQYSDACLKAGFRHSDYITADENTRRELSDSIQLLKKGQLRQPIIEKVLNQMINLVNAIIERYGTIDEIRVELARDLKQTKEQRIRAEKEMAVREKANLSIAGKITELGLPVNRRTIQKYRMWEETEHRCIYCGKNISALEFLSGSMSEVEHIIPRSLFFDDSFTNKTCSCVSCNRAKGQMTAYDFMKSKGDEQLINFQKRVEQLADANKISNLKLKRFLTPADEIPQDFLNRDIQQTAYISKQAMDILKTVARNVYASSGQITAFFRHIWGYGTLLESLNIERYTPAGIVEHNGSKTTIKDWTKRLDHRHHAIDALTVALTRQGYIQRLNTLSASRHQMRDEVGDEYSHNHTLFEQWAQKCPHPSPDIVKNKIAQISVSFKSGKKSTTPGNRYGKNGQRLDVPRGPLHEDTIYGAIYINDGLKPIEKCLATPDIITDDYIRNSVEKLLIQNNFDIKQVKKYLKKNPVTDKNGNSIHKTATRRREFVKRDSVASLNAKQIDKIVDSAIRDAVKKRFMECGSEKAFQQSFATTPLYLTPDSPGPIKRVTRFTGLKESSLVPVRFNSQGQPIGYAKTGNNHHITFYRTSDGDIIESVVSYWTAVKRKSLGLPVIITDPDKAWQMIEQIDDSIDLQSVARTLPPANSTPVLTLSSNQMVVIGLDDDEWHDAVRSHNLKLINSHLYRVQKLSSNDYVFRQHTHTLTTEDETAKLSGNYILLTSWKALNKNHVRPVHADRLGHIILPEND